MISVWNQAKIQQLIDDAIQESLTLDYKAADALAKTDGKRAEITKDVAAMANSAGGIIIYGVKEYNELDKKHLPEKLDPIDLTQFSKEWLEQVIMNIRPRLSGVIITPVLIDIVPSGVVYVVEIPQSTTAHQSIDHRYYKRFNFMSVPMEDYEIRDIMMRSKHPKIELSFQIEAEIESYKRDPYSIYLVDTQGTLDGMSVRPQYEESLKFTLKTYAFNIGSVYAQYIKAEICVPYDLLKSHQQRVTREGKLKKRIVNLNDTYTYYEDNTVRDVIKGGFDSTEKAATRYVPILPKTRQQWREISLTDGFEAINWKESQITWIVYCDNAQPNRGMIAIKDIPIVDRRNKKDEDEL